MKNDKEAVLLTLDQLCQTMDVMRQVVRRLKHSVEASAGSPLGDTESRHPQGQARRDDGQASRTDVAPECRVEPSPTVH